MQIDIKKYNVYPCSICGKYPILQGGIQSHAGRLVCPNYKSEKIKHGNLSYDTVGLPRGFTKWHFDDWWTEDQIVNQGIPKLVNTWNTIHSNTIKHNEESND